MRIVKHSIELNNTPFYFFAPENDSVVPGTVAAMQKNNWKINKIKFSPNDVFVDIGCSVGIVSMVFAKLYPFVKVYSFDANPIAIDCLKLGISANHINNIQYYNLAVGAEDKKNVEFLTYNENESCLIQNDLCNNKDARKTLYKCDMISIANIFDDCGFNNVKYLKVDIETGEFSMFDFIYKDRPDILDKIEYLQVEIHPFDDNYPPSKRLKEMVLSTFKDKVFF